MHVIIGTYPNFKTDKTNLIWDFFYKLPAPDDWVHRLQMDRLMYQSFWLTHPSCFALVDGKRIPNQLCLSNLLTLDTARVILRTNIAEHPDYKYWSVSQGDNPEWCQCPECRKRSASDTLIAFVNAIAKEHIDKIISTLAYYDTEEPPSIKPLPNVQIMLTTIQLPKDKPIETSTRNDVVEWRRKLMGWMKLTQNILIWDYTCNFRHLLVPFPIIYQMCENLQWYAKLGIKNFIIQNNSGYGHEFSELKSYLISELMDNPNQNYHKLIDTFLNDYYGKAAKYIDQYIELMYEQIQAVDHIINWFDCKEYRNNLYRDGVLERADELIYEGWKAVLGDQLYRQRVEVVHLQILYTRIELGIATDDQKSSFKCICGTNTITVNENNLTAIEYMKQKNIG